LLSCNGSTPFDPEDAVESTQRRKGTKTQGLSCVYSVGTHAKEPQRREERRAGSQGKGDQTNHHLVTMPQVTEAGLALRPSRLCGLIGHSSTAWLRLRLAATFTRWVSDFRPVFPFPSSRALRLCFLASLR
jgi:hypothetical protein